MRGIGVIPSRGIYFSAAMTTVDTKRAADPDRLELEVEGMHCASCVSRIEDAVRHVDGVTEASVNLATGRATVRGVDLDPRVLEDAVDRAG